MLRLVAALDRAKFFFSSDLHVCAKTDLLSKEKVLEEDLEATVEAVPRAREVKQGWASAVFATAFASASSCVIFTESDP